MIRDRERYYSPILFFLDVITTFLSYILSIFIYKRVVNIFDSGLTGLRIPVSPFLYWDHTLNILPFLVSIFIFLVQFTYRKEYLQRSKTADL